MMLAPTAPMPISAQSSGETVGAPGIIASDPGDHLAQQGADHQRRAEQAAAVSGAEAPGRGEALGSEQAERGPPADLTARRALDGGVPAAEDGGMRIESSVISRATRMRGTVSPPGTGLQNPLDGRTRSMTAMPSMAASPPPAGRGDSRARSGPRADDESNGLACPVASHIVSTAASAAMPTGASVRLE